MHFSGANIKVNAIEYQVFPNSGEALRNAPGFKQNLVLSGFILSGWARVLHEFS